MNRLLLTAKIWYRRGGKFPFLDERIKAEPVYIHSKMIGILLRHKKSGYLTMCDGSLIGIYRALARIQRHIERSY